MRRAGFECAAQTLADGDFPRAELDRPVKRLHTEGCGSLPGTRESTSAREKNVLLAPGDPPVLILPCRESWPCPSPSTALVCFLESRFVWGCWPLAAARYNSTRRLRARSRTPRPNPRRTRAVPRAIHPRALKTMR